MSPDSKDYITTYTGKHFYPTEPDIEGIDIKDIAHALSLICRGNGHVKNFFSVAQHCILCAKEALARGYSREIALACLLHDASESYMSDVPRPFKKYLGEYLLFENKLLDIIYTRFMGRTLSNDESAKVKEIDDDLLYYDLKFLLGEIKAIESPSIKISLDYKVRSFEEVEAEYLKLFYELK